MGATGSSLLWTLRCAKACSGVSHLAQSTFSWTGGFGILRQCQRPLSVMVTWARHILCVRYDTRHCHCTSIMMPSWAWDMCNGSLLQICWTGYQYNRHPTGLALLQCIFSAYSGQPVGTCGWHCGDLRHVRNRLAFYLQIYTLEALKS